MPPTKVAIIGSGNIGSDLTMKVIRLSETLQMGAMVCIDRGGRMGVAPAGVGL
jgi:acetaldehyde dehydrogenase